MLHTEEKVRRRATSHRNKKEEGEPSVGDCTETNIRYKHAERTQNTNNPND
jgi:hypothetical protein